MGPLQTKQAKPSHLSASTTSKPTTPGSRSDGTGLQRIATSNRHNQYGTDHRHAVHSHQ